MTRPRTRIQQRNSEHILDAALEVFSQHGFRGATLDQIAVVAQRSGVASPAVVVIGDVVGLRAELGDLARSSAEAGHTLPELGTSAR